MAQVLNPRFEDSYQPAAAADEEQYDYDSYLPYYGLMVSNFGRNYGYIHDAKVKAHEKNKKMSYKAKTEEEPPKLHKPPATPLPADNLKSCMKKKKKGMNKSSGCRKVSWAASVYDRPTESRVSHAMEWPKARDNSNIYEKGESSKGDTYNKESKKGYKDNKDEDNDKDKDMKKKKKKKKQVEVEEISIKDGKGIIDKKKGKERGGKHNNKYI